MTFKTNGAKAAMALLAACCLAPIASAQLSRDGGAIEIAADRGELDDLKRQAVYIGNVDVIQGDARLRAERVEIKYSAREGASGNGGVGSSVGDIQTITAKGEVYYITAREKVKADNGVYNAVEETIKLTGNVLVTNEDGVIKGESLTIDIQTSRYIIDGGLCQENDGQGCRVTTVIDQSSEEEPIQ